MVVVHGDNFGNDDDMLERVLYSSTSEMMNKTYETECFILVPHKSLSCLVQPGAGMDLTWSVTVDGQTSTSPVTSYGAPEIHDVWVEDGLLSPDGGDGIIIYGLNFAQQEFLDDVTYGPTGVEYQVMDVMVINDTMIRGVTVPGVGENLVLLVRVGGQSSEEGEEQRRQREPDGDTSSPTISYARPVIEQVTPSTDLGTFQPTYSFSNPSADTTLITVKGKWWGVRSARTNVRVVFGNVADGTVSDPIRPVTILPPPSEGSGEVGDEDLVNLLTFPLPSGEGRRRTVRVLVYGPGMSVATAVTSNVVEVDYAPPSISYVELRPWEPASHLFNVSAEEFEMLRGPGDVTGEEYEAVVESWRGNVTATSLVLLIVHGTNFGTPPFLNPTSTVTRFAKVYNNELGEMRDLQPYILRWSGQAHHDRVELIAPYTSGFLQLGVEARTEEGERITSSSNTLRFENFSPVARTVATDVEFDTDGGEGCSSCNVLYMRVQFLAGASFFKVLIGPSGNETECPLLKGDQKLLKMEDVVAEVINNRTLLPINQTTTWELRCKVPAVSLLARVNVCLCPLIAPRVTVCGREKDASCQWFS